MLARESDRTKYTYYPGVNRIGESVAPSTLNRSWSVDAHVDIPKRGADGPIVVMGGDTNGWSLYLDGGRPTFCYNLAAIELTYIRAQKPLASGRHLVRFEFEKRGKEPFGAGGMGRVVVDGRVAAVGMIPRTSAFGYSLDETFDIGCDKGAPVTHEYRALASFTGTIIRVDIDLKPDFTIDEERHAREHFGQAMLRQ
jgi:arylsulfatase